MLSQIVSAFVLLCEPGTLPVQRLQWSMSQGCSWPLCMEAGKIYKSLCNRGTSFQAILATPEYVEFARGHCEIHCSWSRSVRVGWLDGAVLLEEVMLVHLVVEAANRNIQFASGFSLVFSGFPERSQDDIFFPGPVHLPEGTFQRSLFAAFFP